MDVKAMLKEFLDLKEELEAADEECFEDFGNTVRKLRDHQTAIDCELEDECICNDFDHLVDALEGEDDRETVMEFLQMLVEPFIAEGRSWVRDTLGWVESEPGMDHHEREVYLADVSTVEATIDELERTVSGLHTVESSHGTLTLAPNGEILEVYEHPSSKGDLQFYAEKGERFDVEEARLFYNDPKCTDWDILNLGLHMKDGTYEGPCKVNRLDVLEWRLSEIGEEITPMQQSFLDWCKDLTKEELEDDVEFIYPTRERALRYQPAEDQ